MQQHMCPAPPSRWRSESQEIGSFYTFLKAEVEKLKAAEDDIRTQAMRQTDLILKQFVSFAPHIQRVYFEHQKLKRFGGSKYPQAYRPSEAQMKLPVDAHSLASEGSNFERYEETDRGREPRRSAFEFDNRIVNFSRDGKTSPYRFALSSTSQQEHGKHTPPRDMNASSNREGENRQAGAQDTISRDINRLGNEPARQTSPGSFIVTRQGEEVQLVPPEALRTSLGSIRFGGYDSDDMRTSNNPDGDSSLGDNYRGPTLEPVSYRVPDAEHSQAASNSKVNGRLERLPAFREFGSGDRYHRPAGVSYKVERSRTPRSTYTSRYS